MPKKYAINLNQMLSAMDAGDGNFYGRLDDDQKKEFSAWMAMRWASSVTGPGADKALLAVNRRVNVNFSSITKHPELQWRLIASCGTGVSRNHQFIPPPRKAKKNKLLGIMSELYPLLSIEELELLLAINSRDELREMLRGHGFDNKEIKGIMPK